MPGRFKQAESGEEYRFGFNGMEKDGLTRMAGKFEEILNLISVNLEQSLLLIGKGSNETSFFSFRN